MTPKKTLFLQAETDLIKAIDVDDSVGRSVPINMNFVEEGFLIKDTGYIPFGVTPSIEAHSLFYYKKKSGVAFLIQIVGTKIQQYSMVDKQWYDILGAPVFTAGAYMGYKVYNDILYLSNAVDSLYSFNGTTFTEFATAPKGNILEVYLDRLFITGVILEPLSLYYSDIALPTTFQVTSVLKPLGTDSIVSLVNYYGFLLIFKTSSIWKMSFQEVATVLVPVLEIQSANYGACSRKAACWVENDIWFFTGTEVRSIGYKNQQIGVLGVNSSILSNSIKQTLSSIPVANYGKITTFYENRRYYLAIPLITTTNDTVFVCHTLYENSWTKYSSRDKARLGDSVIVDSVIYTANQSSPYGIIKWNITSADINNQNSYFVTES